VVQRPACSGTVLGWVWVYSVTGCTAESSRAESSAWWWHCAHPFKRRLPSHAAVRHTHHTARAALSAGTSTITGGTWAGPLGVPIEKGSAWGPRGVARTHQRTHVNCWG
jgi:hypothetical protein